MHYAIPTNPKILNNSNFCSKKKLHDPKCNCKLLAVSKQGILLSSHSISCNRNSVSRAYPSFLISTFQVPVPLHICTPHVPQGTLCHQPRRRRPYFQIQPQTCSFLAPRSVIIFHTLVTSSQQPKCTAKRACTKGAHKSLTKVCTFHHIVAPS